MNDNLKMVLLSVGCIVIGVEMVTGIELALDKFHQKKVDIFDQDQTVCYSIGFDSWKRVTNRDRMAVSELVADNKAKMIEAQTLNCYDYSKKPFELIILREQWWRRNK